MARFVTVTVGCDWPECDVTAPEGDGTIVTKQVSIDGKQAREFLLCAPKHVEAFEDVVLPLMAAGIAVVKNGGRPSRKTAGAEAPSPAADGGIDLYLCQEPDCGRTIKKRTGMAQHVGKRGHGYESLAEYEARFGPLEPI